MKLKDLIYSRVQLSRQVVRHLGACTKPFVIVRDPVHDAFQIRTRVATIAFQNKQ